jgi:hypothetical protein
MRFFTFFFIKQTHPLNPWYIFQSIEQCVYWGESHGTRTCFTASFVYRSQDQLNGLPPSLGTVHKGATEEVPDGLGGKLGVPLVHMQLPPFTAVTEKTCTVIYKLFPKYCLYLIYTSVLNTLYKSSQGYGLLNLPSSKKCQNTYNRSVCLVKLHPLNPLKNPRKLKTVRYCILHLYFFNSTH